MQLDQYKQIRISAKHKFPPFYKLYFSISPFSNIIQLKHILLRNFQNYCKLKNIQITNRQNIIVEILTQEGYIFCEKSILGQIFNEEQHLIFYIKQIKNDKRNSEIQGVNIRQKQKIFNKNSIEIQHKIKSVKFRKKKHLSRKRIKKYKIRKKMQQRKRLNKLYHKTNKIQNKEKQKLILSSIPIIEFGDSYIQDIQKEETLFQEIKADRQTILDDQKGDCEIIESTFDCLDLSIKKQEKIQRKFIYQEYYTDQSFTQNQIFSANQIDQESLYQSDNQIQQNIQSNLKNTNNSGLNVNQNYIRRLLKIQYIIDQYLLFVFSQRKKKIEYFDRLCSDIHIIWKINISLSDFKQIMIIDPNLYSFTYIDKDKRQTVYNKRQQWKGKQQEQNLRNCIRIQTVRCIQKLQKDRQNSFEINVRNMIKDKEQKKQEIQKDEVLGNMNKQRMQLNQQTIHKNKNKDQSNKVQVKQINTYELFKQNKKNYNKILHQKILLNQQKQAQLKLKFASSKNPDYQLFENLLLSLHFIYAHHRCKLQFKWLINQLINKNKCTQQEAVRFINYGQKYSGNYLIIYQINGKRYIQIKADKYEQFLRYLRHDNKECIS